MYSLIYYYSRGSAPLSTKKWLEGSWCDAFVGIYTCEMKNSTTWYPHTDVLVMNIIDACLSLVEKSS